MCIYNYVNMSNRVSIIFCEDRFWMERGVVAGSHHSPESFIVYIKNRENTKKILATSEDRTPTVAEKCLSDNRCNRSAKPDFYL